jgi:hypothetical protein
MRRHIHDEAAAGKRHSTDQSGEARIRAHKTPEVDTGHAREDLADFDNLKCTWRQIREEQRGKYRRWMKCQRLKVADEWASAKRKRIPSGKISAVNCPVQE